MTHHHHLRNQLLAISIAAVELANSGCSAYDDQEASLVDVQAEQLTGLEPEAFDPSDVSPVLPPRYTIRLNAVATADSDCPNVSSVKASTLQGMLAELNKIFATASIKLIYEPATDFQCLSSRLVNQRFTVLGNLRDFTDPKQEPPVSTEAHDRERRRIADASRGKLTIFFARPDELYFNTTMGHWDLRLDGGGGSSSGLGRSVAWRRSPDVSSLAHEIGHYLHQTHPMTRSVDGEDDAGNPIDPLTEASLQILAYVLGGHAVADGLDVFDNDRAYVLDTPPDAAGTIFDSVHGDPCGPDDTVNIPVIFPNLTVKVYPLRPDRRNIMSYFKGCFPGRERFSRDQAKRIQEALQDLNRRDLVSVSGGARPVLSAGGSATAGGISALRVARVRDRRVVTATTDGDTLKLIVWDVAADGSAIERRGSATVGAVSGDFEISHAGLDQVLVTHRNDRGNLELSSWGVTSGGSLQPRDRRTEGAVTQIALVRLDRLVLITSVRLSSGQLRNIIWRVLADGSIQRQGSGDGPVIRDLGAASFTPASDSLALIGGLTLFVRDGANNLRTLTFHVGRNPSTTHAVDHVSGGRVGEIAGTNLDFDLAASAVTTADQQLKLIAWHTSYSGEITRRGSHTAPGACARVAAAPLGVTMIATACRELAGDGVRVRLLSTSDRGNTFELAHTSAPDGTATELAMAPIGDDMVLVARRETNSRLALRAWRLR